MDNVERTGHSRNPAEPDLLVGTMIGQAFRVEEKLGSGGMGTVYRCTDMLVGRQVAVKLLQLFGNPSDRQLRRFRQEAAAIGRLKHANIVSVFQMSISDDIPFIVMEYVNGESLSRVLSKCGSLNLKSTIKILSQVADALQHAHESGVVHRDLKPSNIMLAHGSEDEVRILDFGIAKITESEDAGEHLLLRTQTGDIVGTPMYMSPEQVLSKPIDGRSDQYSFGCVLYECLTGAPPFVAASAFAIMTMHTNSEPLPLSQASMGKDFSPGLSEAILRMLKKNPAERFASMTEAKAALIGGMPSKTAQRHSQTLPNIGINPLVGVLSGIVLATIGLCAYAIFSEMKPPWVSHSTVAPSSEHPGTARYDSSPFPAAGALDAEVSRKFDAYLERHKTRTTIGPDDSEPWWSNLANHHLSHVHRVPKLEVLILSKSNDIGDEGMKILFTEVMSYHLPLRGLYVTDTQVTAKGLEYIGKIPSIANLFALRLLRIHDADMDLLKHLKLWTLSVSGCPELTGGVVQHLHWWKDTIRFLELNGINCHGALEPLRKLSKLQNLGVKDAHLDMSDLETIRELPMVCDLQIQNNPGMNDPDKAAQLILSMPNLQRVSADASIEYQLRREQERLLQSRTLSDEEKFRRRRITVDIPQ